MSKQLHKNLTNGQVKSLLEKYSKKEIQLNYILPMLKIKKSRFFELLAKYRQDPDNFSIKHERKTINRKIDPDIEKNIVKELKIEKDLIKNKNIPIKWCCPKVAGKKRNRDKVDCETPCKDSSYGFTCYTKPKWDRRSFMDIPRGRL